MPSSKIDFNVKHVDPLDPVDPLAFRMAGCQQRMWEMVSTWNSLSAHALGRQTVQQQASIRSAVERMRSKREAFKEKANSTGSCKLSQFNFPSRSIVRISNVLVWLYSQISIAPRLYQALRWDWNHFLYNVRPVFSFLTQTLSDPPHPLDLQGSALKLCVAVGCSIEWR